MEQWHSLPLPELMEKLRTDPASGLSRREARARRSAIRSAAKRGNGTDALSAHALFITPRMPAWKCVLQVFRDPFLWLLLTVAGVTLFFGDNVGANIAIFLILFVNCFISGFSYLKAQRIRESMQLYSNPLCKVIRDGLLLTTESRNIVPGDLLLLREGDIIPCDARLIYADQLRVVEFTMNEKREMQSHLSKKDASVVYGEQDPTHAPDFQNMVYGGSAVRSGNAKAIACAVGGTTYLGALTGGIAPAAKLRDPIGLRLLKRYCTGYGYFAAFLIIPITVLGILLLSKENLSAIFLMALSLFSASMTENMLAAGRIIAAAGIADISLGENRETAVVKNALLPDCMSTLTDVWLLGAAALNDGCYHVLRIHTADNTYTSGQFASPDVLRLCEHIYLYSYGQHTALSTGPESDYLHKFDPGLRKLTDFVGTDTEELHVKTRNLRKIYYDRINASGVAVTTETKTLYTYMSAEIGLIGFCDTCRTAKGTEELDDRRRAQLRTLYKSAIENGESVLLYASGDGAHVVFEGAVFMAEATDTDAGRYEKELADMNIRLSVFADFGTRATPETVSHLLQSGICHTDGEICRAGNGQSLSQAFGKYRAYLGFAREEVEALAKACRKSGQVLGAISVDNRNNQMLAACDMEITFDSIRYHTERVSDAVWENMPEDGREDSRRASQITRRGADLLINRFQGSAGGLRGFRLALYYARSFYRNLADMLTCLVASQFLRLSLTLLLIPFGINGLSAPALLFSGLILDFLAVLVFAFSKSPDALLKQQSGIPASLYHPLYYARNHFICAGIAVCGVVACAVVGNFALHDTTGGIHGYVFASLLLLQACVTVLSLLARKAGNKQQKPPVNPMLRLYLCTSLLAIPAAWMIPFVQKAFGCSLPHPILLALLPVGPLLYLVSATILRRAHARRKGERAES